MSGNLPERAAAPTSADDDQLVKRLQSGDEAAFAELIEAHGGRMLATAKRLLGNDADAQDALQEAFLSAFRSLDGFRGGARLGTWLHRIVINSALMRQRARGRLAEQPIDPLLPKYRAGGHMERVPERWTAVVDDILETRERRDVVRAAIDRLPESYRTVLTLRDLEELPAKEVAQALGDTEGAVKVRLHRARLALRTLLDPYMREAVA
jgi:RNA polymerase sigma-70 factor, ECF subfamily